MRSRLAFVLMLVALVSGCAELPASSTIDGATPTGPTLATPSPGAAETNDSGSVMGERGMPRTVTWYLTSDYTLSETPPADGKVDERLEPGGFPRYAATGPTFPAWPSAAQTLAGEIVGDITIKIVFSSETPGVSGTEPFFPSVGGWLGAEGRMDFFGSPPDAPKAVEPGKTYVMTWTSSAPEGGWFLRSREAFSAYPYVAFHTAQPVQYVLGAQSSSISFQIVDFALGPLRAREVLSEAGSVAASEASGNSPVVEVAFALPEGTVYAVAELVGAPEAPAPRIDVDLEIVGAGGQAAGASHGPSAHETVVVGPGQLAALGNDYVARIKGSTSGPGTFTLKVTAFAE